MIPLYDAIVMISKSHPNMTVKEVKDIVNILIEAGIVKDERPAAAVGAGDVVVQVEFDVEIVEELDLDKYFQERIMKDKN